MPVCVFLRIRVCLCAFVCAWALDTECARVSERLIHLESPPPALLSTPSAPNVPANVPITSPKWPPTSSLLMSGQKLSASNCPSANCFRIKMSCAIFLASAVLWLALLWRTLRRSENTIKDVWCLWFWTLRTCHGCDVPNTESFNADAFFLPMWRTKDFYKSFFGYWEVLSTYRAYLGQGCTFTRGTVHAQCLCITYPSQWMFNLSRAAVKSIKWGGWKDARQREQVHLHVPVFTWSTQRQGKVWTYLQCKQGHKMRCFEGLVWTQTVSR